MTYPACLYALIDIWGMSAAQAGAVQGCFSIGFGLSLFGASILCDRLGARKVFRAAVVLAAAASVCFAALTRSFEVALVTGALVGLSQGGTYTPALLLAAVNARSGRKNSAVGWVLAGMSAGYMLSIFSATVLLNLIGYEAAFWATGTLPVLGCLFGWLGTRHAKDTLGGPVSESKKVSAAMRKRARLLTVGYIGHVWELFGMWAWVPAFLAAVALAEGRMSAVELGLWTALALHFSGFVASFLSGYGADRFGARPMLIFFALMGTVLSFSVGWLDALPLPLLIGLVALYGFATIGDSAVLSSAMIAAVPAQHLGKVLGLRSVLGTGAGAISPVGFGLALDIAPDGYGWGLGFSVLALGGLVALASAWQLGKTEA